MSTLWKIPTAELITTILQLTCLLFCACVTPLLLSWQIAIKITITWYSVFSCSHCVIHEMVRSYFSSNSMFVPFLLTSSSSPWPQPLATIFYFLLLWVWLLFIYLKILFIYSWDTHTHTHRERERERGRDTGRGSSRLPTLIPGP